MSKWMGLTNWAAAMAVMAAGCAQQPSGTAVVTEDKTHTVTPASVNVKAGIVTGEVTEMKVTELVEQGSGRVVSPAKLSGTLKLKNTSTNQTVHLVAGRIQYIDVQGRPIPLEAARTEPTLKFATYGSERLDPGQDATQSLDVDFPAEALKAKKLREIRLELAYIPSPYQGGDGQLHRVDRPGQVSQGGGSRLGSPPTESSEAFRGPLFVRAQEAGTR